MSGCSCCGYVPESWEQPRIGQPMCGCSLERCSNCGKCEDHCAGGCYADELAEALKTLPKYKELRSEMKKLKVNP